MASKPAGDRYNPFLAGYPPEGKLPSVQRTSLGTAYSSFGDLDEMATV
jgi:hypothetical protein